MKGCVQWNPLMVEKISPRAELEPGTTNSVGRCLTHSATRAPNLWESKYYLLVVSLVKVGKPNHHLLMPARWFNQIVQKQSI